MKIHLISSNSGNDNHDGRLRAATREAAEKPVKKVRIPELYRSPVRNGHLQGCMKSRA